MKRPGKLSKHQQSVLAQVQASGGRAVPVGGGYWKGLDGTYIEGSNTTHTIQSLAARGLLAPVPRSRESRWHYHPIYQIAEETKP